MRICGVAKNHWFVIKNTRFEPPPFWGYEDIGAFFLLAVLLGLILSLLVRFQFLSWFAITHPSVGVQFAVITEKRRKATPFRAGDIRRICEAKPIFARIRLVLAV